MSEERGEKSKPLTLNKNEILLLKRNLENVANELNTMKTFPWLENLSGGGELSEIEKRVIPSKIATLLKTFSDSLEHVTFFKDKNSIIGHFEMFNYDNMRPVDSDRLPTTGIFGISNGIAIGLVINVAREIKEKSLAERSV